MLVSTLPVSRDVNRAPPQVARLTACWLRQRGWRLEIAVPMPDKCVIIVYPHTSNWDFPVNREASTGFVGQMAARFATGPRMRFSLAPEGTRSHAVHMRLSFYTVSRSAPSNLRVGASSLIPLSCTAARPRPTSPPSNATTATSRPWLRDREGGGVVVS